MSDIYPVTPEWATSAHCDKASYERLYKESVETPDAFWAQQAERLTWSKKPTKIKNTSFDGDVSIKWFEDGELNVCHNCVDRHLPARANQVAIIWEGDNPEVDQKITYRELHRNVCKTANVLKSMGVQKGDRVTIYLPMIPEAA